jgi:hypothetical protein
LDAVYSENIFIPDVPGSANVRILAKFTKKIGTVLKKWLVIAVNVIIIGKCMKTLHVVLANAL